MYSFSFSAVRVVSSAYLRLFIFLQVIFILVCESSSLAFHMMYSIYLSRMTVYSLDVLLSPFGTSPLFQVCFCCFLTCIQVTQKAGNVWYSHLFKNFPQFVVFHTVKGFGIVDETEIVIFLEFLCFFL